MSRNSGMVNLQRERAMRYRALKKLHPQASEPDDPLPVRAPAPPHPIHDPEFRLVAQLRVLKLVQILEKRCAQPRR